MKFCATCQAETEHYEKGNCKQCRKRTNAIWYAANSTHAKATAAARYAANPAYAKANSVVWSAANRERKNATNAAWNKANRIAKQGNKMPGIPIKNLSRKSTEQLTVKLLAEKELSHSKDLKFKTLEKMAPKPRVYEPGMALPLGDNIFARDPYVVGDGDHTYQVEREGSRKHECCCSAETAGDCVYPRHHK